MSNMELGADAHRRHLVRQAQMTQDAQDHGRLPNQRHQRQTTGAGRPTHDCVAARRQGRRRRRALSPPSSHPSTAGAVPARPCEVMSPTQPLHTDYQRTSAVVEGLR